MPVNLIIFDCDGTLTDSEMLNNKATADVLARLGYPQYTLEYSLQHFAGLALNDIKHIIEEKENTWIPDHFIPDFIRLVSEYQDVYLEEVKGACEAANQLSNLYKTCVASNGERNNVIKSLKIIGLHDLFGEGRIFTKSQVTRGKPAPDLFLFAANQMQCPPETCIVIEDSVAGVKAGVAAGMRTIGLTAASHDPGEAGDKLTEAGAHIICGDWSRIQHSINSLTEEIISL
jgi:HAD superfamily hydrolase (TIGR01509 family)